MTATLRQADSSDPVIDATALRRGDAGAFDAAVRQLTPRLLGVARRIVGEAEAEDVVQEAWLAAFQQLASFEERARFETWMTRIVVNRAISRRRGESRASASATGDEDPSASWFDEQGHWRGERGATFGDAPDHLLEAEALQDCLQGGLAALPELQRQVLLLREIEQWDLQTICNELDISASNARVTLHRGRMKLMAIVERYGRTGSC